MADGLLSKRVYSHVLRFGPVIRVLEGVGAVIIAGLAYSTAARAADFADITAGLAAAVAWDFARRVLTRECSHACVLDGHLGVGEFDRVLKVLIFTQGNLPVCEGCDLAHGNTSTKPCKRK